MAAFDFLRKIELFAQLPAEDLERLCQMTEDLHLQAGEQLFEEGSLGDRAYVIQKGLVEIRKVSAGREVLLAVRKPGEVFGEMSLIDAAPRIASAYARTDCDLIIITHDNLETLINASPSAARTLLRTVTDRLRQTNVLLRESEKLAQLGQLTAGIAHELNNPASAVQRGSQQIRAAIQDLLYAQNELSTLGMVGNQLRHLQELEGLARERARMPLGVDPVERSDLETEVEEWLDSRNIDNPWDLAPQIVNLGLTPDILTGIASQFTLVQLPAIFAWLCALLTVYQLIEEMDMGAGQISTIIKAMKAYVYLDQAPVQSVDIHEGLDNTLILLRSKLKENVRVNRSYAPDLPKIVAYGSELNQVWTNLIDNAIDAMNGKGEITLCTRQEGDWIVVGVEDSGPGIPSEIQSRIFDPFFTTKPQGKGTGLGLSISFSIVQKHGGDIKLKTHPGKTLFEVWLPLTDSPS